MATTRSNALGCGSLSSWIRMVRFSMTVGALLVYRFALRDAPTCSVPKREMVNKNQRLLRRERVLRRVLLRRDLADLRLALHRALDGELGRLVVELVDLVVVRGLPVDEHAADDHQVVGLAGGDD